MGIFESSCIPLRVLRFLIIKECAEALSNNNIIAYEKNGKWIIGSNNFSAETIKHFLGEKIGNDPKPVVLIKDIDMLNDYIKLGENKEVISKLLDAGFSVRLFSKKKFSYSKDCKADIRKTFNIFISELFKKTNSPIVTLDPADPNENKILPGVYSSLFGSNFQNPPDDVFIVKYWDIPTEKDLDITPIPTVEVISKTIYFIVGISPNNESLKSNSQRRRI